MTDNSEWLQSVPQGSFESLSPLCNLQKKTKHFELWVNKAKEGQLATSKWETVPSSSKVDTNVIRGSSLLPPKESTVRSSEQRIPYLSRGIKKPSERNGPLSFPPEVPEEQLAELKVPPRTLAEQDVLTAKVQQPLPALPPSHAHVATKLQSFTNPNFLRGNIFQRS